MIRLLRRVQLLVDLGLDCWGMIQLGARQLGEHTPSLELPLLLLQQQRIHQADDLGVDGEDADGCRYWACSPVQRLQIIM